MEKQILCENKWFKLFILFRDLINVWGGKRLISMGQKEHSIDTNTSAKIYIFK